MPRNRRIPSLRRHSRWKLGVVTLNGKDHYLGKWPNADSPPPAAVQAEYDRLIAEWLSADRRLPSREIPKPEQGPLVSEIILAYLQHVDGYYRDPAGRATTEQGNIRQILRRLRKLYGQTEAEAFDSLALEAFRDSLIREGLARRRINKDIVRVKAMFTWAAAKRLIPSSVPALLRTVRGLEAGRSAARETESVTPVPEEHVIAVLPHLAPAIRAMVSLQRLTGMRPGEVVQMRTIDIDRSDTIWVYRPEAHKTAWRGKERIVLLGPNAQVVLQPWLRAETTEYLFQPCEVVRSQCKRRTNRQARRAPGKKYRTAAYGHAVRKACRRAKVPVWSPGRLRHNFATEVRSRYGLEAAGALLGHSELETSQIYAERDFKLAARIAREVG